MDGCVVGADDFLSIDTKSQVLANMGGSDAVEGRRAEPTVGF